MAKISPLTVADGTICVVKVLKPHPGRVQIVAELPSGDYIFLGQKNDFHTQDKIDANVGAAGVLPTDWPIEERHEITIRAGALSGSVAHTLGKVPALAEGDRATVTANATTVTATIPRVHGEDLVIATRVVKHGN